MYARECLNLGDAIAAYAYVLRLHSVIGKWSECSNESIRGKVYNLVELACIVHANVREYVRKHPQEKYFIY